MIEFITEIIDRFGGRLAGSEQERQAQYFLKERLDEFCTSVHVHEFSAPLDSKPESPKLFCILFYISIGLFWYDITIAFGLALVNAILFYGHFVSYRGWLDFLFPKKNSLNVTGVLDPVGEVKSTILISGHMDSTREFIWWYWLKNYGIKLMIVGGLLFFILPVFYLVVLVSGGLITTGIFKDIWWILLLLTPSTLSYFFMRGKIVVPGAQDNLSGVSVALDTVRSFAHPDKSNVSTLKNTRLKVVSFGSEEAGLVGSGMYAASFYSDLKNENAILINLDGIMNMDEFHVVEKERMTGVTYNKILIERISDSFNKLKIHFRKSNLLVGATDAASLSRKGIPSVTILGLPIDRLDKTYHTRLDLPQYIDQEALKSCKSVLQDFIIEWDKKP